MHIRRLMKRLLRRVSIRAARASACAPICSPLEPRLLLTAAPTISSSVVGEGDASRSIVQTISVAFSEQVSIAPDAVSIFNLTTQEQVAPASIVSMYDAASNTARWTFPGLAGQSLPDGNYRVVLRGTGIADVDGQPLDGDGNGAGGDDHRFEFFRFFGDADGDRDVDFADLFTFRQAYQSSDNDPQYDERFDLDADSDVDVADLFAFRGNLQQSLPEPPSLPTDLFAYDGFDYAPGGSDLSGKQGGGSFGFSGAWNGNVAFDIVETDLNDPTGLLEPPQGGHVTSEASDGNKDIHRDLETPVGSPGTTAFFSFLMQPQGALGAGADGGYIGILLSGGPITSNDLFIIASSDSNYGLENVGGAGHVASDVAPVSGEPVLLVVRADFEATADRFSLFINPSSGVEPARADVVKTDLNMNMISRIYLGGPGAFSIDELRVGPTFGSVTDGTPGDPAPPPVEADLLVETDTTWRAIGPVGDQTGADIHTVGLDFEAANPGWNSNVLYDDSAAAGWSDAIEVIHPTEPFERYWVDGTDIIGSSPAYFRKTFEIDGVPTTAFLDVIVDDDALVYINGHLVVNDSDGLATYLFDLDVEPWLVQGTNLIAVKAHDGQGAQSLNVSLRVEYEE